MYEFLQGIIPNVVKTFPELTKAFFQTLQMVGISALWSAVFGVFFGVVLVVTAPGGIMENRFVNSVLDKVINVFRSIPFVILIALLLPLTRVVMGTSIGTKGAMFPLVIGTIPFFSRQIHSALCEVDKGVIEADLQMGGEDFAFYQEKVPGAMVLLGVRNEACDAVWPQHHGCYKVDESVLVKGAALHVQTALDFLGVDLQ